MSLMHAPNPPLRPDELSGLKFPLLASEKLDGWRMVVMGNVLLTKSGVPHVNRNLSAHFADLLALSRQMHVFDCELWAPGMSLAEIQTILQSRTAPIPPQLSAHVFDYITLTRFYGSHAPRFERRIEQAREIIERHKPAHTVYHPHHLVTDAGQLGKMYQSVLANGGEGLILRDPAGGYRHGRCTRREALMFKLKPEPAAAIAA